MNEDLINGIQLVRHTNNVLWMDILRIALHAAPHATKMVLKQIRDNDLRISELTGKLADEDQRPPDITQATPLYRR
jgi:hypothetical protein